MHRIMRVAFKERTLDMGSLHNRMTNLTIACGAHEAFFPGRVTERMSADVNALMVEVYSDTVNRLREILEFSATVDVTDGQTIRDFAVETALAMNRDALPWRNRIQELLNHFNSRGEALFAR